LNPEEKDYLAFATKNLTVSSTEIASFPLAQVGAGKPLPLKEGLNPAWANAMANLENEIVRPLFGNKVFITEADWAAIASKFGPYEA